MPRGDRSSGYPHLGSFGVVLAIAFSCLLVGGLAYLQGRENERRDNTPKSYEESAKKHAERACIGVEPSAVFECVYGHVEASTQTAHDEQDLSAQQRAATSALASAVFALLTLGLSGLGVWYVKRTLDATLAAVEDTGRATDAMFESNRIARDAQRPWMKIDAELLGFGLLERRVLTGEFEVHFTNIGKTVAQDFQAIVKFTPLRTFDQMYDVFDAFPDRDLREGVAVIPGHSTNWFGTMDHSFEHLPWNITKNGRQDCYIMILAMCRYKIPGDSEWHYSMDAFVVGENLSRIDNRRLRYRCPDNLKAEDMIMQRLGRNRAT